METNTIINTQPLSYAVLSIKDLRAIMAKARADSRARYDGKVRSQSTVVIDFSSLTDKRGETQLNLERVR